MLLRNRCPACDGAQHRLAFHVQGFAIAKCERCQSLFVRQPPDPRQIQSIYLDQAYYRHEPASIERIQAENARRCRTLARIAAGRKLLDVGCAAGYLLDAAQAAGFESEGVDQTPHTVAEARAKGHRVTLGTLDDVARQQPSSTRQFDVVTALDVIEHVPEPQLFLQQLADFTRPGGVIVLSTPNYSGLVARWMGPRDPYMTPPEHLNFFTFHGLKELARRTRLEIERTETFGRLTGPERQRIGGRFLPGFLRPLQGSLGAAIGLGIRSLNLVQAGIEAEVYLRKPQSSSGVLRPAA
jgi:SAM-dependent methyltransferase